MWCYYIPPEGFSTSKDYTILFRPHTTDPRTTGLPSLINHHGHRTQGHLHTRRRAHCSAVMVCKPDPAGKDEDGVTQPGCLEQVDRRHICRVGRDHVVRRGLAQNTQARWVQDPAMAGMLMPGWRDFMSCEYM